MVRDVTLYDYYPKQRLCLSGCWPSCLGQWYYFLFRSPPFSKWPKGEICDTWMCSGTGSVTNNLCFLDCKSEVSRTKRQLSSNIARDKDFIFKKWAQTWHTETIQLQCYQRKDMKMGTESRKPEGRMTYGQCKSDLDGWIGSKVRITPLRTEDDPGLINLIQVQTKWTTHWHRNNVTHFFTRI